MQAGSVRGSIIHVDGVQGVCTPAHHHGRLQMPRPHPHGHGKLLAGGSGKHEEGK